MSVVDATGLSIVGATVNVAHAGATTVLRTLPTDARGEALINNLQPGVYAVHVLLDGFREFVAPKLALKPGANRINVTLEIAALSTSVTVAPDAQAAAINPNGDSMTTTLGQDALDALPEDETDLQQTLSELAGSDAEVTVDGLVGGTMPPKSQIQQIRIRRDVFSADRHGRGGSRIEIVTRPGTDQWRSMLSYGFRDDALNARNAFAETRPPERQDQGRLSIQGPLVKGRTSVALFVRGLSAYDSSTIRAATPDGLFNGLVKQPEGSHNVSVNLQQALARGNMLRFDFRDNRDQQENQGVGDFNLPEHGYTSLDTNRRVRVSDEGALGGHTYNTLGLLVGWTGSTATPVTSGPAVVVLDTMTTGGATQQGLQSGRSASLQEKLDYTRGQQAISVGGELDWNRYNSDQIDNGNGTFTFSTLADYEAGQPNTYTQWLGNPAVDFSAFEGAWFVQDDLQLRKNLMIGLGLRNEWQSQLQGTWNPAPRLGVTWAPFTSGRTTIRGGYGVFHDWYDASTYEDTLQTDGTRGQDVTIEDPGYPDPFVGGQALVLPSGRIVASADLEMPTIRQSSIGLERRIGRGLRADATYIHRTGDNLMRGRNLNAPGPDGIRPDPSVGNIIEIESIGRMQDDQLRASLGGQLPWRHAFLSVRYTYGQSFDDGDGATSLPADNEQPDEWGPSSDDVRHELSLFGVADVLKSVQAGFTLRAQSAPPYTITTGTDDNGDTVFNDRPAGVGRNSARASGQFRLDLRLSWRLGMGAPGAGAGGPQRGRGGPGRGADWRSQHRALVELYVRATNVLNTVNYTGYRGTLTSPFFGEPTSARAARQIELGTMLMF
ncbi:MAG TPA: carboxypeptidase regulatory-like domain-containing protein [Vicinamibacterales bacterium]